MIRLIKWTINKRGLSKGFICLSMSFLGQKIKKIKNDIQAVIRRHITTGN
jgi:hypothetical protein